MARTYAVFTIELNGTDEEMELRSLARQQLNPR